MSAELNIKLNFRKKGQITTHTAVNSGEVTELQRIMNNPTKVPYRRIK